MPETGWSGIKRCMRNLSISWHALLLWAMVGFSAIAQQTNPPANLPELQRAMTQLICQPKYDAALWGVQVISLDTGKVLFEHNQQKLFSPASNCKLYTVALALDRLGPDYKIRTSLLAASKPDGAGTLSGDLIVYGRGDPTINARLHQGDIFEALQPLVSALTNAGVQRVQGDLVGDASFLRGPEFGSGWTWDDPEYSYGAEVSALTINDNIVPFQTKPGEQLGAPCRLELPFAQGFLLFSNRSQTVQPGQKQALSFYRPLEENVVYVSGQVPLDSKGTSEEMTVHNPALLFVTLFRQALTRNGITVQGRLRTLNWLDCQTGVCGITNLVELAWNESLPMRDLAREVQKPSQNLYADLLLAQVGEHARFGSTPLDQSSEDLGLEQLNKFLSEVGVKKGDVWFEEGSGLSRNNLATPEATVKLLGFMSRHKCADAYINALPIAGVDGTLRNRMKGTPAAGNVRAKTGTLRWANSLSGYVTTAAGERLAFSLMVNRFHPSPAGGSSRADLDAIAVLLASFRGRSGD